MTWGKWRDLYTGRTYTKASDIDIDHIVPLGHAHKTGGAEWSRPKKRELANDPDDLLAVEDNANQAKGDKGPARWPPTTRFMVRVRAEMAARKSQVRATHQHTGGKKFRGNGAGVFLRKRDTALYGHAR